MPQAIHCCHAQSYASQDIPRVKLCRQKRKHEGSEGITRILISVGFKTKRKNIKAAQDIQTC